MNKFWQTINGVHTVKCNKHVFVSISSYFIIKFFSTQPTHFSVYNVELRLAVG